MSIVGSAANAIREDSQLRFGELPSARALDQADLAVIFLVVYVVALAATLAPALRASRIRPAEALRYQ